MKRSEEKWGETSCVRLTAGGWGDPSSEDPGEKDLDVENCGVLVPVVCSVDFVQCGSLVCGVQLSRCCLLRGLPLPCCMFLALLS